MVYASSEAGKNEAYVRPFPDGDSKWLVSQGTGVEYRWRGDGRELYYRSGDRLMAVEIKPGPTFRPGEPKELFESSRRRRRRVQPESILYGHTRRPEIPCGPRPRGQSY